MVMTICDNMLIICFVKCNLIWILWLENIWLNVTRWRKTQRRYFYIRDTLDFIEQFFKLSILWITDDSQWSGNRSSTVNICKYWSKSNNCRCDVIWHGYFFFFFCIPTRTEMKKIISEAFVVLNHIFKSFFTLTPLLISWRRFEEKKKKIFKTTKKNKISPASPRNHSVSSCDRSIPYRWNRGILRPFTRIIHVMYTHFVLTSSGTRDS